jgi:hypothetical protein
MTSATGSASLCWRIRPFEEKVSAAYRKRFGDSRPSSRRRFAAKYRARCGSTRREAVFAVYCPDGKCAMCKTPLKPAEMEMDHINGVKLRTVTEAGPIRKQGSAATRGIDPVALSPTALDPTDYLTGGYLLRRWLYCGSTGRRAERSSATRFASSAAPVTYGAEPEVLVLRPKGPDYICDGPDEEELDHVPKWVLL